MSYLLLYYRTQYRDYYLKVKEKMKKREERRIQSVDRALRMMEILSAEREGLTLKQLSRKMSLSPQTAQGLLRTLQAHNMVWQSGRGETYRFGPAITELAGRWRAFQDRPALAREPISQLAENTREYVILDQLQGNVAVALVEVPSNQPLSVSFESRSMTSLHTMATGKVLLAWLDPEDREAVIAKIKLTKTGPRTITDKEQFSRHIERIRKQGFAVCLEECGVGIGAMGVPVRASQKGDIAALGLSAPMLRFGSKRRKELLHELFKTAADIERLWFSI
jgi:DNA-binding IclR family transcriptional regulator